MPRAHVQRVPQTTVNWLGANGRKVREALRDRFREADLSGVPADTREMVIAEYVRTGHYRIYARGGFPDPKVPQTPDDHLHVEMAKLKRQRRMAKRRLRNAQRFSGKVRERTRVHLTTVCAMGTASYDERLRARELGIGAQ